MIKILLLTNRDSDNVGDQVIEACDIALIEAAMKNLGIAESDYEICSRAASIVPKKYVSTRDENLLQTAEKLISESDMVIFGGAPLFNYLYQIFYERTAITIEIAQKYGKPVIFSAIGIEQYDENNEKCQRLKKTLNFDCVKQITTRDGFEELKKYKENENLVIDQVSDPAVFASTVFRKYHAKKKADAKKKVGIFVFRANGFKDNKIDFTREDAAKLWKDIIAELEKQGYDYTLLTSGHFGDEAFLDYMIREHGIKESKCVFNMNTPERLIKKISTYDGIISCRLHPSIISYSLKVPSVGLIWNPKVSRFYESIGYKNRSVQATDFDAKTIVQKMDEAIANGVTQNTNELVTIYQYLFYGIKRSLNVGNPDAEAYNYEALVENIPAFAGTSPKEEMAKLKRKFRRVYNAFNESQNKKIPFSLKNLED